MNYLNVLIIKIGHLNIQSITNKIDILVDFLTRNSIKNFSLNETWLKSSKRLKIPNYVIHRNDRLGDTDGGGVCICVHKDIPSIDLTRLSDPKVECVIIKIPNILQNKKDLILVSYYNPPELKVSEVFLDFLFETSIFP